ncbi:MAG: 50S ribosomal protein L9 [Hyphomicrobiales bacterium]
MDVILLERIDKLGDMGAEIRVKDGYARNFLLPQGKALRANKANRAAFERDRAALEQRNAERRGTVEDRAGNLADEAFVVIRQAGESGQLYGSVSTRDIAKIIIAAGVDVHRNQVILDRPIKTIGMHDVRVALHPEVIVTLTLNVARSADEAEAQAHGEDMTIPADEGEAAIEKTEEEPETKPDDGERALPSGERTESEA